MRKTLIALLLLCSASLFGQSEILAPGMRLGPESRIADFTFGEIPEDIEAVLPNGSGYITYTRSFAPTAAFDSILYSTPVSGGGMPDQRARKNIPQLASIRWSSVVISAGRPLLVGFDNESIYVARLGDDGMPSVPTRVASGNLQQVACHASECLFAFNQNPAFSVLTDSEGRALTNVIRLPGCCAGFDNVASITAGPNGFILFRPGGNRVADRVVRIDRAGHLVFDIALPPLPLPIRVLPAADHDVLVAMTQMNGDWFISASDLGLGGALGQPRPLTRVRDSGFYIEPRGSSYLLAVPDGQHVSLFDVSADVTAAVFTGEFDIPASYSFVKITSNGNSTIAFVRSGHVLFTMPIEPGAGPFGAGPFVLSYGPLPQQANAIVDYGPGYLIAWSELDAAQMTLRATRTNRSGVVLNTVQLARSSRINLVSLASVASDVLVVWYDWDLGRSAAAIVHSPGGVDSLNLGGPFIARAVIPRVDDWVVIADGLNAIRVSRSGMTYPARPIAESSFFLGADSDGSKILILTASSMSGGTVLAADLTVERRMPYVGGAVAFSDDSYLVVSKNLVTRIDRNGEILSSAPASGCGAQEIAATARGWLLLNTCYGNGIAQVLAENPPFITSSVGLSGIAAIAKRGDNRLGMLFATTDRDRSLAAPAIFLRELELYEIPRKRAVPSR